MSIREKLRRMHERLGYWREHYDHFCEDPRRVFSVPCDWIDDNLPIGLQIISRRFNDISVLRAAASFECALPRVDKIPPVE